MAHGLADPCLLLTASLQAQVVLSFQAYPIARCALLEVQVPADLVQPGQSVVCQVLPPDRNSHLWNPRFPKQSLALSL